MDSPHKVFCNDPVYLRSLIHRKVSVTVQTGITRTGWVYTVDPVTETFVLVDFPADNLEKASIFVMPGFNVTNVDIHNDVPSVNLSNCVDSFFLKVAPTLGDSVIEKRRQSLCIWLNDNRVPYTVREDMTIQVLQVAVVTPPYTQESIECTNEVILDKVMKLVLQMPLLPDT